MQMNHREGYGLLDDQIRAKPTRMNLGSASQSDAAGVPHNSVTEMQQYAEAVSGQQQIEDVKPTISSNASLNSSQNLLANARMLPPGNPQALQMSQGLFSGVSIPQRSQQLDPQPLLHQQQQQQQPQQQLQQQQQQAAAAAAAATTTTTTTKPTFLDSTAASPVPEVTFDACNKSTFALDSTRTEFQYAVGQSHGQAATSAVTAATTAATGAKENDGGTWSCCGYGKHG
jgi:hypothetical protein